MKTYTPPSSAVAFFGDPQIKAQGRAILAATRRIQYTRGSWVSFAGWRGCKVYHLSRGLAGDFSIENVRATYNFEGDFINHLIRIFDDSRFYWPLVGAKTAALSLWDAIPVGLDTAGILPRLRTVETLDQFRRLMESLPAEELYTAADVPA